MKSLDDSQELDSTTQPTEFPRNKTQAIHQDKSIDVTQEVHQVMFLDDSLELHQVYTLGITQRLH